MRQSAYRGYLLALLMIILAFNYVDRIALGVVLEDIKADLALSDTELGFLSGIAFALFYSVMGIPIARWADRGNRVTIIALTTGLWSAAVALCGFATSFIQLLLIRIGVAVGEAGCVPPAHSLIADSFSRIERPRAVSRYMLGGSIALLIGYFAVGWLNEFYGWRSAFIVIGLPGLILAAVAALTLREPRFVKLETASVDQHAAPMKTLTLTLTLRHVMATLWANAAFRHLLFCFSIWFFFGYGLLQWQPAFFIRSHGLQTGELGTWFAGIYGIVGGLGIFLGGELAARYAAGNEWLQLNACALAFAVGSALMALAYLATDYRLAFGLLALAALTSMAQGPMLATMQTLVQPPMRAMSIALVYLFANLVGMGLGPLAVGALSDALRPWLADESLRYALAAMCPGYIWAAWHLRKASRTVASDLARAQTDSFPRTAITARMAVNQ
jgi:MFS family permease